MKIRVKGLIVYAKGSDPPGQVPDAQTQFVDLQ